MRARVSLVVLVLAAGSLAAAGFAGAQRARTVARQRAAERHLVAARGGAALAAVHVDGLVDAVRAAARGFDRAPGPPGARLRALHDRSLHFRIVSLVDQEGRAVGEPVFRDVTLPDPGGRRHPPVRADELGEHLRRVPVGPALGAGFSLSVPFMRGGHGPFVVLAASCQAPGESQAPGDPGAPGSLRVLAAEIALDWLVARLRTAVGGPHEILLLDEQHRVLGGGAPLTAIPGLGPEHPVQAATVELPGDAAAGTPSGPMAGAIAPVLRYGWTVLARAPHWRVVPLMSSLSIVWALASLVVLLGAATALARGGPERRPE